MDRGRVTRRRARLAARGVPRRAAWALAGLVVWSLAACTAPATPAPSATGQQVEVLTWWASGAEKLAMDVLVQQFRAAHPDVTYVDGSVVGGAGSVAKDVLGSRLANHDPPDTFQVHGGAELAAHVEAGQVQPLTDLYDRLGLTDVLSPAVLDLVSVDGVPYAVPVDVHRANLLWANTAVLVAAGLDPTARYDSLDSWLDALSAVRASGHVPLALGSTWTQVHLLEAVLLSRLGPQAYAGLWDGTTDATSPAVATAVGDFARLLGYTNPDRDSLDWQDAATLVANGDAAFTVMGDWAQQVLDPPVVWAPFPGTEGVDDVVLDAFAVPVGAPHPDGAEAWLTTIAGAETQAAFANAKGAAPARADVPMTALDTYPRTAFLALRSGVRVPSLAHGMAAPPDALTEITDVVARLANGTASTSQLQAALAEAATPAATPAASTP